MCDRCVGRHFTRQRTDVGQRVKVAVEHLTQRRQKERVRVAHVAHVHVQLAAVLAQIRRSRSSHITQLPRNTKPCQTQPSSVSHFALVGRDSGAVRFHVKVDKLRVGLGDRDALRLVALEKDRFAAVRQQPGGHRACCQRALRPRRLPATYDSRRALSQWPAPARRAGRLRCWWRRARQRQSSPLCAQWQPAAPRPAARRLRHLQEENEHVQKGTHGSMQQCGLTHIGVWFKEHGAIQFNGILHFEIPRQLDKKNQ